MSAISFPSTTPDSNDSPVILLQKALATINALTTSIKFSSTVVQAADQSVSSANTGATLVNATNLAVNIAANTTYKFRAYIQINEVSTVAGVKLALTGPAGFTSLILTGFLENGTSTVLHQTIGAYATIIAGGIATSGLKYATLEGIIVNGANAGTLQVQFAQNAADANNTTLKAGSWFEVKQV